MNPRLLTDDQMRSFLANDHGISRRAGDAGERRDQVAIGGVADMRHDDADNLPAAGHEAARRGVGRVGQRPAGFEHLAPGRLADHGAVVDDVGDGLRRNPCQPRDVLDRRPHRPFLGWGLI